MCRPVVFCFRSNTRRGRMQGVLISYFQDLVVILGRPPTNGYCNSFVCFWMLAVVHLFHPRSVTYARFVSQEMGSRLLHLSKHTRRDLRIIRPLHRCLSLSGGVLVSICLLRLLPLETSWNVSSLSLAVCCVHLHGCVVTSWGVTTMSITTIGNNSVAAMQRCC